MRVPRVKSDSLLRRKADVTWSGPRPRSTGGRCLLLLLRSESDSSQQARPDGGEGSLAPTPIRVATAGEHHILYAREAQARRLWVGVPSSASGGSPPHPLDEHPSTRWPLAWRAGLRPPRRARRHDPLLAPPPQRDHQLARQRHNANAAEAAAAGPEPLPVPARQRAVGLPAHPRPCDFHHDPADVFEAGPTNPLVMARLAALIGHRHQAAGAPTARRLRRSRAKSSVASTAADRARIPFNCWSRCVRTAAGVAPAATCARCASRACRNACSIVCNSAHCSVRRVMTPAGRPAPSGRVTVASCGRNAGPRRSRTPCVARTPCRRLRYRVRSAVNIARLRSACRASSTATVGTCTTFH